MAANNKEASIRLIELYKSHRNLWDPKDSLYLNKNYRENCWRDISEKLNIPVEEVKKKMESLAGSYRREKSREKKSRSIGDADLYISKWFGYPYFEFLRRNKEHRNIDSPDISPTEENSERSIDVLLDVEEASQPSLSAPNPEEPSEPSHSTQDEYIECIMPTPQLPVRKKRKRKAITNHSPSDDLSKTEDANDPYTSFGNYIASELRKYDQHTLACVKNAINNVIFDADLGKYAVNPQPIQDFDRNYLGSPTSSSSSRAPTPTYS